MIFNLFSKGAKDEYLLEIPTNGGLMNQTKFFPPYEWKPSEDKENLAGDVKFIIGGMFTREIHLNCIDDCMYIADLIENAYKMGYMNGKDKIRHKMVNVINDKD